MATRIEIGDPVQYAGVASQILQAAWKPPCLHYSTDYLTWQFSFPSEVPKNAAIAFLEDRPVGCIAVTSRRFSCAHENFPASVLSFVAVAPSAGRRGLAGTMYASLLDALPPDVPVFAFAEPDSIGEHLLLNSFSRAAFRHRLLRTCRAVGYLRRSNTAPAAGASAQETTAYEEFASAGRPSGPRDVIWADITKEHWQHYRQDPRGRVMVTVRDAAGNPLGTAMLVTAEVVSSEGVQKVPMLDSVALAEPTPAALAALFAFAATRAQPGSTVIASNLSYIDVALLRAAGARALPSSFNAHAFIRGQKHVVETAAALNLEVT
jgi:hypothetical protein